MPFEMGCTDCHELLAERWEYDAEWSEFAVFFGRGDPDGDTPIFDLVHVHELCEHCASRYTCVYEFDPEVSKGSLYKLQ